MEAGVDRFLKGARRGEETAEQTLKRLLFSCHPDKVAGREEEARVVLAMRAAYLRRRPKTSGPAVPFHYSAGVASRPCEPTGPRRPASTNPPPASSTPASPASPESPESPEWSTSPRSPAPFVCPRWLVSATALALTAWAAADALIAGATAVLAVALRPVQPQLRSRRVDTPRRLIEIRRGA